MRSLRSKTVSHEVEEEIQLNFHITKNEEMIIEELNPPNDNE